MKFKRNVAFGEKILATRGEVLTEAELGFRMRKLLVARGTALLTIAESPEPEKVVSKPKSPPEDKAVKPKSTKRKSTKSKGRTWHSGH